MEPGFISAVNYANGGVLCDVEAVRVNTQYDNVPVLRTFGDQYAVPKVNSKVVMDTLSDGRRIIVGVLSTDDPRPTDMQPGEYTIRLDDGTAVELSRNDDDTYDLDLSTSGDISIQTDGTLDVDGDVVQIDGSTDVQIDGIDFDEHTHQYEDGTINDTESGGSGESTTTKTTDAPQ